ncbi:hypothetical protein BRM83_13330, partial [Xanthomonas oryzae pv. oryzae]
MNCRKRSLSKPAPGCRPISIGSGPTPARNPDVHEVSVSLDRPLRVIGRPRVRRVAGAVPCPRTGRGDRSRPVAGGPSLRAERHRRQ